MYKKYFQKNFVMSQKVSTFASAFEKKNGGIAQLVRALDS